MNNEQEFKQALATLCERFGIKGHLLLYLEGEKVRFVGELSVTSLMPLVLEHLMKRGKP